tara:strand:+ start:355983 stop:356567 length:585 start_codon:yes stop_codon:yes gene_type:complete
MNYANEPYPNDLNELLKTAGDLAILIIRNLNRTDCPALGDLYFELHKTCGAKPEFSIRRNVNFFNDLGYRPNNISGRSKSKNEFKGLYVFGEEISGKIIPVYIGISRTVYRRLRQHGWGKKHNECSLAYLKARFDDTTLTRATTNNKTHLIPKKQIIQNYKVVLIPVQKDYDLYFLEVAIAGILKTKWNSFRTH